jgi:anti-anti-sigma factor
MRDSILHLHTRRDPARTLIQCAGELDFSVVGELRTAIDAACTPGLELLSLDMRELEFMDSSGLQCLLEAHVWCETHGARFEVMPSRAVQRLLDLAGAVFESATPDAGADDSDQAADPASAD